MYGVFLVFGLSPAGPHNSIIGHFVGVMLAAFAIISFMKNSKIFKSTFLTWISAIVLLLPPILLVGFLSYVISVHGVEEVFGSGGDIGFLLYIVLLLPAPLSFITAWFANQRLWRQ
jgi:hypothetical protein